MKKKKKTLRAAARKTASKPAARKSAGAKPAPKSKMTMKPAGKTPPKSRPKASAGSAPPESRFPETVDSDPAHRPGHRKINVEANFGGKNGAKVHLQDSAVNRMSRAEKIKRTSRTNRRIISGAAVGKTGRIVTEKV